MAVSVATVSEEIISLMWSGNTLSWDSYWKATNEVAIHYSVNIYENAGYVVAEAFDTSGAPSVFIENIMLKEGASGYTYTVTACFNDLVASQATTSAIYAADDSVVMSLRWMG